MNEFLKALLNEYGVRIIGSLLMIIFSYVGTICGKAAKKYIDTKTKKTIANTVVQSVEQMYKDLHGEEKLLKAMESASELLTEKGIKCTTTELKVLLEGAVGEFNNTFNKNNK